MQTDITALRIEKAIITECYNGLEEAICQFAYSKGCFFLKKTKTKKYKHQMGYYTFIEYWGGEALLWLEENNAKVVMLDMN